MIVPILKGGLGNQLFQIANAYAFAKRHKFDFGINYNLSFSGGQGNLAYKYRNNLYAKIPFTDMGLQGSYIEPTFSYSEIPARDNVLLHGFFQSEKYFMDFENDIKNLLNFPDETKNKVNQFLSQFNKPIVSLHIRRGDYLNLSHFHKIVDSSYYLKASKLFGGYQAVICTDDAEAVKREMRFSNAVFLPFNDEIDDMYLLSQCDSSVICNSSFSWWGAYLGKDKKIVVAPKEWFASAGPQDYQDIYRKDWIVI